MKSEMDYYEKREKAKKRVEEIKGFYNHVKVYIIINILIILIKGDFLAFVIGNTENADPRFQSWLDINFILTPVLWGIGLLIHGIVVFRYKVKFFKNWEERQIRKYLEEEDNNSNLYN